MQLIKAIQIVYQPREAEALISTSAALKTGRGYKNKLKRALAKELERRLRDGSLNLNLSIGGSGHRHVGALGSAHAMGNGLAGVGSAASKSAALAQALQQIRQQRAVSGLAPPLATAVMPGMPGLAQQQLASHWSELPWAQSLARGALASGRGASSWARIQRIQAQQSHQAAQLQHRALQRQYDVLRAQLQRADAAGAAVGALAGTMRAPVASSSLSAAPEFPVGWGVPRVAAESLAAAPAASTTEAGVGSSVQEGSALDALSAQHVQQHTELDRVQVLETMRMLHRHAQEKKGLVDKQRMAKIEREALKASLEPGAAQQAGQDPRDEAWLTSELDRRLHEVGETGADAPGFAKVDGPPLKRAKVD